MAGSGFDGTPAAMMARAVRQYVLDTQRRLVRAAVSGRGFGDDIWIEDHDIGEVSFRRSVPRSFKPKRFAAAALNFR